MAVTIDDMRDKPRPEPVAVPNDKIMSPEAEAAAEAPPVAEPRTVRMRALRSQGIPGGGGMVQGVTYARGGKEIPAGEFLAYEHEAKDREQRGLAERSENKVVGPSANKVVAPKGKKAK